MYVDQQQISHVRACIPNCTKLCVRALHVVAAAYFVLGTPFGVQ